jgi:hypothetical protein
MFKGLLISGFSIPIESPSNPTYDAINNMLNDAPADEAIRQAALLSA